MINHVNMVNLVMFVTSLGLNRLHGGATKQPLQQLNNNGVIKDCILLYYGTAYAETMWF